MKFKRLIKKAVTVFSFKKKSENIVYEQEKKYIIGHNVEFSESEIGDYSYISPDSKIHSASIGKFCSIGPHVIIGYGEHPTKFLSTSPLFYYGNKKFDVKIATKDYFNHHQKVIIKNDVWIGANVYVKNGITVGNGAVIAAGAVVVNNVPDYAIVGGVPAKVIKYRFESDIIEKLLEMKWWEWKISEIEKKHHLFVMDDIENVLNILKDENE